MILCRREQEPGKEMRKKLFSVIALVLCALMLASFLACGTGKNEPTSVSPPETRSSATVGSETGVEIERITLEVQRQEVDIIRERETGSERLVYFQISCPEGVGIERPVLTYTDEGRTLTRELGNVGDMTGPVYDTVWISASAESVSATVSDENGEVFWQGYLEIVPADRNCTVPRSHVYSLDEIPAASLHGVNYYPRRTPWTAWTSQDPDVWDSEFQEISQLYANVVRTFAELWDADMYPGWCPKPEYLETVSKLFGAADRYGMKVLFCLHSHLPSEDRGCNLRYVRGIMEPFVEDGRVFAWDLINEVDAKGLLEEDYIGSFCQEFNLKMSQIDPNHPNTIGFAYMLEKAEPAGLAFDGSQQFWQYHWYRTFSANTITKLGYRYFHDRPFIIGECGDTSLEGASDADRSDTGEDWQASVYECIVPAMLGAAQKGYDIKGVLIWTAFDYPTMANQLPAGQGEYGVIREDGSLKPAGEILAEAYAGLRQTNPAPWER